MPNPAKTMACSVSGITPIANLQSPGLSTAVPYRWTATLTVTAQNHSSTATRAPRVYNGLDVAVGDYVARTTTGIAVKIIAIASQTASTVTCTLEDENQYNALRDPSLAGSGIFTSGACVIFNLNALGVPVIDPVPTTVVAPTFITNVKSRFESAQEPQAGGGSSVSRVADMDALPGSPSTGDLAYVSDKGDGAWGLLMWSGTAWETLSTAESVESEGKTLSFTVSSATTDGSTTINAARLAALGVVTGISVRVVTPFNDPTATLSLGITGTPDAFMTASENDLGVAGLYVTAPNYVNGTGSDLSMTYTLAKGSSSVGTATVTLTFS